MSPTFDAALLGRLRSLLQAFAHLHRPQMVVDSVLVGGMAVALYTSKPRICAGVDLVFNKRVYLPHPFTTPAVSGLFINPYFKLWFFHPDAQADAVALQLGVEKFTVRVLTPTDLAVSKITRLTEQDRADVKALVGTGLTTVPQVRARTQEAIADAVACPPELPGVIDEFLQQLDAETAESSHLMASTRLQFEDNNE